MVFFRYDTYDLSSGTANPITIGPISFTTQELFTSFMSGVLVLPPVVLITLLFVKADPRSGKAPGNEESDGHRNHRKNTTGLMHPANLDNNSNNSNNNTVVGERGYGHGESSKKQARRKRYWPHWCRYLAWCLTLLTIAAAAFFTIFYSFEFGGEKSRAWLIAFFLSFFESVLLLQPIKVLYLCIKASDIKSNVLVTFKTFLIWHTT